MQGEWPRCQATELLSAGLMSQKQRRGEGRGGEARREEGRKRKEKRKEKKPQIHTYTKERKKQSGRAGEESYHLQMTALKTGQSKK